MGLVDWLIQAVVWVLVGVCVLHKAGQLGRVADCACSVVVVVVVVFLTSRLDP